jgi:hypothetical protein
MNKIRNRTARGIPVFACRQRFEIRNEPEERLALDDAIVASKIPRFSLA